MLGGCGSVLTRRRCRSPAAGVAVGALLPPTLQPRDGEQQKGMEVRGPSRPGE
ncbi:MAG: hypothetical protein U0232_28680 [Thermomicrobiales bacterium]